jgi:hypothetical protein
VNDSTLVDTVYTKSLTLGQRYFWRVKAYNLYGESAWSTTQQFTVMQDLFSVTINVNPGWNLVSVPMLQEDLRTISLFAGIISQAYAYGNGYIAKDTLQWGRGYWLKFDSARTFTFTGNPILSESIHVIAGWNLIGSVSASIAVTTISASVPEMITGNFFTFGTSYAPVDTLRPGGGYWVKVNQDGFLFLSGPLMMVSENRIRILSTSELPPPPPGTEPTTMEIPKEYLLEQNYPNPFNPGTLIQYHLPNAAHVTLLIYNTLGQLVMTLLDGYQDAGYKSVKFEMTNLPSGVYMYRLTAGTYTDMKKMILTR